ncbi:PREDICTED: uncharacterized protein LOC108768521 [Trachymyrmex cornetzi]|uniref:uncharacterized protein LOC108768521 n=1 Tax=Trachymyrmex cornetzi TaxID=471704 RepID=UPI00084F4A50|nr:PREDICTED: uncharacterized protein LOC108768521 [Trachymyrmex cornetzi]
MTLEMGCYFACIAAILRQIFCLAYNKNYGIINNEILYVTVLIVWLFIYIFRLLLINYVCERVSTKANATGNFINKLSYLTYDTEIYENILQFSLQIVQSPLRFYGLGLFQFGFKFLYGFFASISTLLVIYTQTYISNKYLENNN